MDQNFIHIAVGPGRGTWDDNKKGNEQTYLEIETFNSPTSSETTFFSKKYKDQNDRIGKIYRFKRPLDQF